MTGLLSVGFYTFISFIPLSAITVHPLTSGGIVGILVILALIVGSAAMSGSEVAYFSLAPKDKAGLIDSTRDNDRRVLRLLKKPQTLLATILIANNLFNVGIIITSYYILHSTFDFSDEVVGFLFEVVIVTFFIVLFGEVIPKIFANQNNVKYARSLSAMLLFFRKLFGPVSFVLIRSTNFIEDRLKLRNFDAITQEELNHAIDIASSDSTSKEEVDILKGIVKFGNITVKQIMCSRVDIVAIEMNSGFKDVFERVLESGYSRIPAYEEDIDHIKGILYAKDLLKYIDQEDDFNWHDLLRPPFFVPENKRIEDLMKEFQTRRIHQAIVVDEYGGTSGIITLEDIMEEIIGDIKDEFDELKEIEYQKIDDHNYVFEGKTLINDVCKIMVLPTQEFEEAKGEADTLAGLLLEITQKMPVEGEVIVFRNYKFTVVAIGKKRIKQVKITII